MQMGTEPLDDGVRDRGIDLRFVYPSVIREETGCYDSHSVQAYRKAGVV